MNSRLPAQDSGTIDSLNLQIKNASHDTLKIDLHFEVISRLFRSSPDEAIEHCNAAIALCKPNETRLVACYSWLAVINENKGDMLQSIACWKKCYDVALRSNDKNRIAYIHNNLASNYQAIGNIQAAVEAYMLAIRAYEETKDQKGIAIVYSNLGKIYYSQGDVPYALELWKKSLGIRKSIGDLSHNATYSHLGSAYLAMDSLSKALEYYQLAYEAALRSGKKYEIAFTLNSLSSVFSSAGDHKKAIEYQLQSLKMRELINDKQGIATSHSALGVLYLKLGQKTKSEIHLKKGKVLSLELGTPALIKYCSEALYRFYKEINDPKKALENYELVIKMRDSLTNETNRKASIKSQLKYEYEKQAAADSVAHAKESEIKNAELAKQKAEISAKKNQQYALFGGLGLVMIFAGFMYNRFKVTQKQKGIIEEQKEVVEEQKKLVEEKQKEVLDSIHYSKRIQMAQIPSEKRIETLLKLAAFHKKN